MVVSKTEFNNALEEINESYTKLREKFEKQIEILTARVEELESKNGRVGKAKAA